MWIISSIVILGLILALLGVFIFARKTGRTQPPEENYLTYYEDGLIEVSVGLGLIAAGLAMWFDFGGFIGVMFALIYPVLLVAKQSITAPRISAADLPSTTMDHRRSVIVGILTLTLILGVLVFLFMAVGETGSQSFGVRVWLQKYLLDLLLLIGIGSLAFAGYKSEVKRLFGYAGLLVLIRVAGIWLNFQFPIYVMVVGLVVLLTGLYVLARFLESHPKIDAMHPA